MPELKILVVDDNEEFCQNIKDVLELKGCAVTTAYNGFKALELVKQNSFDLILMDVKMPIMDGVTTFRKIKEMAVETSVIMITAFAVEGLIREALRQGAFGSLKKPLDFDRLFELIKGATTNVMRLLVVDDDPDFCANIKDVLSDRGYQVSVAYDGSTAIQMAWENNFDILLIDLKLPPLNGLETYLSIKGIRPNVVAIIITGYRQETGNLIQQGRQESVYACLEKPVDMEALISLLGQITERKAKSTLAKLE